MHRVLCRENPALGWIGEPQSNFHDHPLTKCLQATFQTSSNGKVVGRPSLSGARSILSGSYAASVAACRVAISRQTLLWSRSPSFGRRHSSTTPSCSANSATMTTATATTLLPAPLCSARLRRHCKTDALATVRTCLRSVAFCSLSLSWTHQASTTRRTPRERVSKLEWRRWEVFLVIHACRKRQATAKEERGTHKTSPLLVQRTVGSILPQSLPKPPCDSLLRCREHNNPKQEGGVPPTTPNKVTNNEQSKKMNYGNGG